MKSVTVALLFALSAFSQNKPLADQDIIDMVKKGMSIEKIAVQLQQSQLQLDVTPSGIETLTAAGLQPDLINLLISANTNLLSRKSFGTIGGKFPLQAAVGHTVRFSGWIKTENIRDGYAGLWWRVDGSEKGKSLAFDNSMNKTIDGKGAAGDNEVRGAFGNTTNWTRYEIELPVAADATNIDFGVLFTGTGTAWFDSLQIELDGIPWSDPQTKDLDFELPALKGFGKGGAGYTITLDNTTSYTGRQSLKMQCASNTPITSTPPLTNTDIISMTKAGVSEINIFMDIQNSPAKFDISPEAINLLGASGVSGQVVNLMTRSKNGIKPASAFGVLTGTFPVAAAAGHTIRFSAWIKTENVDQGYVGPWWRVDGPEKNKALAFDNSQARIIDGKPATGNGLVRGAQGTRNWSLYQFELPVAANATNINFGVLFNGIGTAWVDDLSVEIDGVPWSDPKHMDFGFESTTPNKGFYTGGPGYRVAIDNTVAYTGKQSLKMQFTGD